MSETVSGKAQPKEEPITWEEFLTSMPPGRVYSINAGEIFPSANGPAVLVSTLKLFCDSEHCSKICFFDSSDPTVYLGADKFEKKFITYFCRHCKKTSRIFAVAVRWEKDSKSSAKTLTAVKLGEWPPFGPHTPTKVNALIGSDRELYFNGRRSEALGMGIGALTYYRRVVENQKNRIIDEITKVCTTLNAGTEILTELEAAKREIRFTAAVDKIKAAIPQVLLINGQNPLTLLHGALSEGVHDKTDGECLEIAMSIRIVLSELAERMAIAVKDESELSSAVKNLLKFRQPPVAPISKQ